MTSKMNQNYKAKLGNMIQCFKTGRIRYAVNYVCENLKNTQNEPVKGPPGLRASREG